MVYSSVRMHRIPWATCLAVVTISLAGCNESAEIVSYSVPKEPPRPKIEVESPTPNRPPMTAPFASEPSGSSSGFAEQANEVNGPDRMLGAVIARPEQTWFFKLTGPEAPVSAAMEPFVAFLKGVEFGGAGDAPKWQLPEGWKEAGERPMRFATLEFDSDGKKLELAISSLPTQADADGFLLMNLNRWLGQMSLLTSTLEELRKSPERMETIELPGGNKAVVVGGQKRRQGRRMEVVRFVIRL